MDEITIGDWRAPAIIVEIDPERAQDRKVRVEVAVEDLVTGAPDYAVPLQLHRDGRLFYGGFIVAVELVRDGFAQISAGSLALFGDQRTGGLGVANLRSTGMDVLLSMTAANGVPLQAHNWNPPMERFVVAVPIENAGAANWGLGPVTLQTSKQGLELFERLGPDDLREAFWEPGAWAWCLVERRTVYEAEQLGVAIIQRVINRLSLAARYTLATSPAGVASDFTRARTLEALRIRPIAAVQGLGGKRAWLRGYTESPVQKDFDVGAVQRLGDIVGVMEHGVDDAIEAWRRAVTGVDETTVVVALGESLEWYVNTAHVKKLFTRAERAQIIERATAGLSGVQLERVQERLKHLNEPTYAERLAAVIALDKVPIRDSEAKVLERVRECRNAILHGRERKTLTHSERIQGTALVNRLLVFRLHRLATELEAAGAM